MRVQRASPKGPALLVGKPEESSVQEVGIHPDASNEEWANILKRLTGVTKVWQALDNRRCQPWDVDYVKRKTQEDYYNFKHVVGRVTREYSLSPGSNDGLFDWQLIHVDDVHVTRDRSSQGSGLAIRGAGVDGGAEQLKLITTDIERLVFAEMGPQDKTGKYYTWFFSVQACKKSTQETPGK